MTTVNALNALEFPLSGTRLIEASAGTGKTYTIAALYVRLILGHQRLDQGMTPTLMPPDILVVTFTDAATRELRERIRERLSQAGRFFREQATESDGFLESLRADYAPQDWPGCARKLELAANWMDESAVYTIHGWCNRMLQQHAFDTGSLFHQEVNTTDTELLNEVVRNYWRHFYYPASQDPAVLKALYAEFKEPEALGQQVLPLLNNLSALPNYLPAHRNIADLVNSFISEKQNSLQAIKSEWLSWTVEIEALITQAVREKALPASKYKSNIVKNWMAKIDAWRLNPDEEALDIGKGFESLSPDGLAQLTLAGHSVPQHPGFSAISQVRERIANLPSLRAELIKHAVHWIWQSYNKEKRRLARMTFDDMLTRLDSALQGANGDRLAQLIRQAYPIALIDEFQDTDPVQYRIFSRLYPANADGNSGCFMIGDPKQAIYSFRGADIFTYLKAHQATLGFHYTLGTNYRSTKALVSGVNRIFKHADQQPEGAFRFKTADCNPLPFIAVKAQGRSAEWVVDNQPATALTLWHWQSESAVDMTSYRQEFAAITASEIVRLLNGSADGKTGFVSEKERVPLQPSDIAILVRSGHEAKVMRSALANRGLRCVYLSENDSIFATPEAQDLLIWLKALAEPRDERKVRSALSTGTLGWQYQALQDLVLDEPLWESHLERFLNYQKRWREDGILPAIRQLLHDYQLHAQLNAPGNGERRLTNLLHLAEILQSASSQLEGEQALIRHLAESMADPNHYEGDDGIIRLESDDNLIKIITIHKSKGLEYPLVFLPFIASFRDITRKDAFYRYHDAQENLKIDLDKADENLLKSSAERLQEDIRLLYVALTRARYACWLGIAPIKIGRSSECDLAKSALGYLLGWQEQDQPTQLANKLAGLKGTNRHINIAKLPEPSDALYRPPVLETQLDSIRTAKNKIFNNWWIASYSALQFESAYSGTASLAMELDEPETAQQDKQSDESDPVGVLNALAVTVEGVHSLPRGVGPGLLVHDLLEYYANTGFDKIYQHRDSVLETFSKKFEAKGWTLLEQAILAEALSDWLNLPLLDNANLCLGQLTAYDCHAEMEFLIAGRSVNVQALDQLVSQFVFADCPRPALSPKTINGLLKGFIDLVFVHKQKYYVVDYKFNYLGADSIAYCEETLQKAMLSKRYDLQGSLYLLALHRLLTVRLGEAYDYDLHIGGCLYLFLRGTQGPAQGRVFFKPPRAFIEKLDALFYNAQGQGAES